MKANDRQRLADIELTADRDNVREIVGISVISGVAFFVLMVAKRPDDAVPILAIGLPFVVVVFGGLLWRILHVSVVARGDVLTVRNWFSTRSFRRADIRQFVIMEDRPVSAVQDLIRRKAQSPVLTFVVLKDGTTVDCRALSLAVTRDLQERVERLQRWLAPTDHPAGRPARPGR